ncbi:MAG: rhomboid family intramembrane serine protease [Dysgonamonadaceae bacterium]|jgi:membrane associated rhomboid family serine protease|nr:rhomboid family intramembrane serine protease [Dysgonamonadaceae bacterium]
MAYYQRRGFLDSLTVVTKNLLIINIIIWAACNLIKGLYVYLALFNIGSGYFNIYQLVSYMFTHIEFNHLFFNMFALFMFGSTIESYWGQKRFLIYYMVTGIGAGLIQLLTLYIQGVYAPIPTIGASGAIFGLLLAFGMLFPNTPLYIMFIPIPIKAKYMVIGYGLIEFFFGIANAGSDNVAHFAHLGGMLFGIILILYWRRGYNYYHGNSFFSKLNFLKYFKGRISKTKRKETDWDFNARKAKEEREINSILEKIKLSGYNSLTEAEKLKLFEFGKKSK